MKKTMNFFLILGLFFTFLVSACSDKGDSKVIGAWHKGETLNGFQLSQDGSYYVILNGQEAPKEYLLSHGKYTVNGDKITFMGTNAEGKEIRSTSTFTVKDNTLMMTNPAGETNKFIKQ